MKNLTKFFPEFLIFAFAALTRFLNLDFPKNHMFDEVYHAFTAQRIFYGDSRAWEWWNTPPPGFAFEWTHPPLAKEFMASAIFIFGDTAFAWRFFSALFGTLSIILIYLITLKLFKSRTAALLAALVAAFEGLLLVMSRIGMNDSYFLFFSLLAVFCYLNNRKLLTSIALGLAISSKWAGAFVILAISIFELYKFIQNKFKYRLELFKTSFLLLMVPIIVYLGTYIPFFLGTHIPPGTDFNNFETFIELQSQMFFYHTGLTATHPYQSTPIDWIFNLRPVWIFVEYKYNFTASVYTLGNPAFVFGGLASILYLLFKFIKKKSFPVFIILASYFLFFAPWTFSPRIMFNYHYLLSSSFLAIALGIVLREILENKKLRVFGFAFLILTASLFIYFYPLWTGTGISKDLYDSYFWLKSWK